MAMGKMDEEGGGAPWLRRRGGRVATAVARVSAVTAMVVVLAAVCGRLPTAAGEPVPLVSRVKKRQTRVYPPDGSYIYVPVGIDWDGHNRSQSRVKMCRLAFADYHATPAVTPMIEDLINQAGCRKSPIPNPANTYLTTMGELELEYVARGCASAVEAGDLDPSCAPSGVIFHESRCGSTLLSNMIAALPSSIVFSEIGPPNNIIRDLTMPFEERVHWLRVLFAAMARPIALHAYHRTHPGAGAVPGGPEPSSPAAADWSPRFLFLKTQHTTSLYLDVYQAAFPRMPWIYLHRDPVEVMMSLLRDTPFAPLPDAPPTEHLTLAHMDNLMNVPCMRSKADKPIFLAQLHNFTDKAAAAKHVATEDWCAGDLAWVIAAAARAATRARLEVLARAVAIARYEAHGGATNARSLAVGGVTVTVAQSAREGSGPEPASGGLLGRTQRQPGDPSPHPNPPPGMLGAAGPHGGDGGVAGGALDGTEVEDEAAVEVGSTTLTPQEIDALSRVDVTRGDAFAEAMTRLTPQCVIVRDGMVLDSEVESGTILGVGTGIFVEYPSLPLVVPLLLDSHLRPLSATTRSMSRARCTHLLAAAAKAGWYTLPDASPPPYTPPPGSKRDAGQEEEGLPPVVYTRPGTTWQTVQYPYSLASPHNLYALTLPSLTPPPPLPFAAVLLEYQEDVDLSLTPSDEASMMVAGEFYSKSRATVAQLAKLADAPGGIRPFQRNGEGRLRAARAWTSIDVQGKYISDAAAKQTMAWAALRSAAAKFLDGLHALMVRFNVPFSAAENDAMNAAGVGELIEGEAEADGVGGGHAPPAASPTPAPSPIPSTAPPPLDTSPSLRRYIRKPDVNPNDLPLGAGLYPQMYPLAQILNEWNPDIVTPPGSAMVGKYNSLRYFDFHSEAAAALEYRRRELPFVVYNVTDFDATVTAWEDDAVLLSMIGSDPVEADLSESAHFLFYSKADVKAAREADPEYEPPTTTVRTTFADWLRLASTVADEVVGPENEQLPKWWQWEEEDYRLNKGPLHAAVDPTLFHDAKVVAALNAARDVLRAHRRDITHEVRQVFQPESQVHAAQPHPADGTGDGSLAPTGGQVDGEAVGDGTTPPATKHQGAPRLSPTGKRTRGGAPPFDHASHNDKAGGGAGSGNAGGGGVRGRKLLTTGGGGGGSSPFLRNLPIAVNKGSTQPTVVGGGAPGGDTIPVGGAPPVVYAPHPAAGDQDGADGATDPAGGAGAGGGDGGAFVEDSEENAPVAMAHVRNPLAPTRVWPSEVEFDGALTEQFFTAGVDGVPDASWFVNGSHIRVSLPSTPIPPVLFPVLQFDSEVADVYGLPSHKPTFDHVSRNTAIRRQYLRLSSGRLSATDEEEQRAELRARLGVKGAAPGDNGQGAKPDRVGMGKREVKTITPTAWMKEFVPFLFPDQVPQSSFFVVNPDDHQGVHCRFGMPGILAEAHYDAGRNFVAMGRGWKRYILLPPDQCGYLGLAQTGPSARHSQYDWTDPAIIRSKLAHARGLQVVLQPGEVLYIPALWIHFVESLTVSIACNARSGTPPIGLESIEACGFSRPPVVEEPGMYTAPPSRIANSSWATTRLLPPLELARLRVPSASIPSASSSAPATLHKYNTTPIEVLMPAHRRVKADHIVELLTRYELDREAGAFTRIPSTHPQTPILMPSNPPSPNVKDEGGGRGVSPAPAPPSPPARPSPARTEVTGEGGLLDEGALKDPVKTIIYGDVADKLMNHHDDLGAFAGSVGVAPTKVPPPSGTSTPRPNTPGGGPGNNRRPGDNGEVWSNPQLPSPSGQGEGGGGVTLGGSGLDAKSGVQGGGKGDGGGDGGGDVGGGGNVVAVGGVGGYDPNRDRRGAVGSTVDKGGSGMRSDSSRKGDDVSMLGGIPALWLMVVGLGAFASLVLVRRFTLHRRGGAPGATMSNLHANSSGGLLARLMALMPSHAGGHRVKPHDKDEDEDEWSGSGARRASDPGASTTPTQPSRTAAPGPHRAATNGSTATSSSLARGSAVSHSPVRSPPTTSLADGWGWDGDSDDEGQGTAGRGSTTITTSHRVTSSSKPTYAAITRGRESHGMHGARDLEEDGWGKSGITAAGGQGAGRVDSNGTGARATATLVHATPAPAPAAAPAPAPTTGWDGWGDDDDGEV